MKYLPAARPRHRPPGSSVCCTSPLSLISLDLTRGLLTDRRISFPVPKDPSSDIVVGDFGMCVARIFSPETCLIRVIRLSVPNTSIPLETSHVRCRKSRICSSRGAEPKGARQTCRSLVNRVGLLALVANHSWYAGILIVVLRDHYLRATLRIHAIHHPLRQLRP